jgi:predicted nuclease with TOPRIM domain
MESGVTTPNPITRNTQREVLPPRFTAVDEKRFESEIKRIDTTLADERKNREKFESEVLKRFEKVDARFDKTDNNIKDLRSEINTRFEKMEKSIDSRFDKVDARFDKLEKSVDSRFAKTDSDIKDLRGEMNARFEELRREGNSHFLWMMGVLFVAILIPIALQYFAK